MDERVCFFLKKLRSNPPNFLIFEGGDKVLRENTALFWASLVNCKAEDPPCKKCEVCKRIEEKVYKDLFIFEADESKNIKIDEVSTIKTIANHPPDEGNYRVFIFSEAHKLTPSASNSLLKILEEPLYFNLFVFLVPHRSLLLSTILSRGYIFTLKWKQENEIDKNSLKWIEEINKFWITGKDLFSKIEREKIDKTLIIEISTLFLKELLLVLAQERPLYINLKENLPTSKIFQLINLFNRCIELSQSNVNPSYILQWIGVKGFLLLKDP